MTLEQFSKQALARAAARHRENGADMVAGFTWNQETKRYELEVSGYVVAECATLAEVRQFSDMHNTTRAA